MQVRRVRDMWTRIRAFILTKENIQVKDFRPGDL